jgi:hypothetical protein
VSVIPRPPPARRVSVLKIDEWDTVVTAPLLRAGGLILIIIIKYYMLSGNITSLLLRTKACKRPLGAVDERARCLFD